MKKTIKIAALVLLIIACAGVVARVFRDAGRMIFPLRYEDEITAAARENGLDKFQVMGVIFAESQYSERADSKKAKGLMQITDETAKEICGKIGIVYTPDIAYNAEINIKMGCFYLAYLKGIYNDETAALAAYNAGPGKVREWLLDKRYSSDGKALEEIPYPETRDYVARVKTLAWIYKKLYK